MSDTPQKKSNPVATLADLFHAKRDSFAAVLPRHVSPDQMVKSVLGLISRTPDLLKCDPVSVYMAVMQAAELGLTVGGVHQHCYLIPRRNKHQGGRHEATFMVGYKGLLELARRSAEIRRIDANVVYQGENFALDPQTGKVTHDYSFSTDRSDDKVVGAYAYAYLRDSEDPITRILNRKQIEDRRRRSGASNSGPWVTDYEAMCRKTALRALLGSGLIPLSNERLSRAVELDDTHHTVDTGTMVSVMGSLPEIEKPIDYDIVPGFDDDEDPDPERAAVREEAGQ